MNSENSFHEVLPAKPERKPRQPETYPNTEHQPAASGSLIEYAVREAKRDLGAASEADIEAALADIKSGELQTLTTKEAIKDVSSAYTHGKMSKGAVNSAREIEADFMTRYGIDIAHPEKNPFHMRALLKVLQFFGAADTTSYRYAKEDASLSDDIDRGYRRAELAVDKPEVLAAIQRTETGIAELKKSIEGAYGVSPDEFEHAGADAEKFGQLLETNAAFQSDIRRYRVAEGQLERLLKDNDVKEV